MYKTTQRGVVVTSSLVGMDNVFQSYPSVTEYTIAKINLTKRIVVSVFFLSKNRLLLFLSPFLKQLRLTPSVASSPGVLIDNTFP